MKKNYIIIITVFILIVLLFIMFYNYKLEEKRINEFNNILDKVTNLDDSIKEEIKKIDGNEEITKNKDVDEKLDKINHLALKTKKENEDILSSDILKSGTSTGTKYTGEACKDACW